MSTSTRTLASLLFIALGGLGADSCPVDIFDDDESSASGWGALDCEELAVTAQTDDPDPCDIAACEDCVDDCEHDCVVLSSNPPRYSCGMGTEYNPYDNCPDWEWGE